MAVTVRSMVEEAYRLLGAVAHDDAMTADQGQSGLTSYNAMIHAWELDGITLSPAFSDQALDDDFPLADKYREGTTYLLASRISPKFMAPAAFDADAFFRKMQSEMVPVSDATFDDALTWKGSTLYDYWTP